MKISVHEISLARHQAARPDGQNRAGEEKTGAECREQGHTPACAEIFSLDIPFYRTLSLEKAAFLGTLTTT
jgi:hypothetical protein